MTLLRDGHYVCPECRGSGYGLYWISANYWWFSQWRACRTCGGRGLVDAATADAYDDRKEAADAR